MCSSVPFDLPMFALLAYLLPGPGRGVQLETLLNNSMRLAEGLSPNCAAQPKVRPVHPPAPTTSIVVIHLVVLQVF